MRQIALSLLFCLLLLQQGFSQEKKGTSVLYKYNEYYLSITINGEKKKLPDRYCRMVFRDSLSFTYNFNEEHKDPFRKTNVFIVSGLSRATYYFSGSHQRISVMKKKKNDRKIYQVSDTAQYYKWELFDDQKIVAGFLCRSALAFRNQTDSVIAWYTTDIPGTFSPGWYTGLPGVVLELQDNYTGDRFSAIKVESLDMDIRLPDNAIPVKDFHTLK